MTQQDQVRDHDFDGIREFDNRLPNWWLWSFYLACIFSVIYWVHYHVLRTGAAPLQEYAMEMKAADERAAAELARSPVDDASLLALAQDAAAVAEGRKVFMTPGQCVTCHKEDGGGLVGPNLTDNAWIHGGSPMAIHKTISKGVPEKGMQAWESLLGPAKVRQVTAFVLTLKGKNAPNGKAPEGKVE